MYSASLLEVCFKTIYKKHEWPLFYIDLYLEMLEVSIQYGNFGLVFSLLISSLDFFFFFKYQHYA